jgi:hypothetical protein
MANKLKRTLNMTDKFFIDHNKEKNNTELSKLLKVTVGAIKKYKDEQPATEHIAPARKNEFYKKGGAFIMTQTQADKDSIDRQHKATPDSMKSCVYRMDDADKS